jgi:hypothetical protein
MTTEEQVRLAALEKRVEQLEQIIANLGSVCTQSSRDLRGDSRESIPNDAATTHSENSQTSSPTPQSQSSSSNFLSLPLPQSQSMFDHHYNYFFKTLGNNIPAVDNTINNNSKNLRFYKHFKACFGEVPSKKYLRKLFGKQYDAEHKFVKLVVKMYNWYNQIKCKKTELSPEFIAVCEADPEWKWSKSTNVAK